MTLKPPHEQKSTLNQIAPAPHGKTDHAKHVVTLVHVVKSTEKPTTDMITELSFSNSQNYLAHDMKNCGIRLSGNMYPNR